ncbi:hypothetical protein [Streptomyces akebiae]|uniref:Uncharacterized protein n=1 Tax=Streptomyces akebiae TaxID=2865673 RepID=A0ABX8Y5K7_9ACTN|nr:hypothetical protein [Streptomyces akebiae]QYX83536.1 hypothetical protein K1J60_41755 [Streptomyces akebiae]
MELARGLAVFGMYAAHLGPDPSEGGTTGFLVEQFSARPVGIIGAAATAPNGDLHQATLTP